MSKVWLVSGTSNIKFYFRNCEQCAKARARPRCQVVPTIASAKSGVDYAGPIKLHKSKGRGVATYKGYIALFVCMATKAVHIEVVGDQTTASFFGALEWFISRRGKVVEIWSDNATTFQGANAELRALLKEARPAFDAAPDYLAKRDITLEFIPAKAQHFGGFREAGVKSTKSLLKKILESRILTFEEISTLTVRIKMALNCRPLTALSRDADDLEALTPGHLIRGAPLNQLPALCVETDWLDRLQHWNLMRGMYAKFWNQWSRQYLNTLQQRHKWTRSQPKLQPGDIVLVLDSALLNDGRWLLGRVLRTFHGKDNLVRSTKVRTATGTYTRPILKLARMPISEPGKPNL